MDVCESHTILVRCIRSRLGISPTYGICHLLLQFIYVFHPYHTAFLLIPHSLYWGERERFSASFRVEAAIRALIESSMYRCLES